jgi:hypothetical protein
MCLKCRIAYYDQYLKIVQEAKTKYEKAMRAARARYEKTRILANAKYEEEVERNHRKIQQRHQHKGG